MPNEQPKIRTLPLWESAYREIIGNGWTYGTVIPSEWFEERLSEPRGTMKYDLALSQIRDELRGHGMCLSGRGHNGRAQEIIPANGNADVIQHFSRAAKRSLERGLTLGTNTPLELLTPEESRKHQAVTEKIGHRLALVNRSESIAKVVKKYSPNLLRFGGA